MSSYILYTELKLTAGRAAAVCASGSQFAVLVVQQFPLHKHCFQHSVTDTRLLFTTWSSTYQVTRTRQELGLLLQFLSTLPMALHHKAGNLRHIPVPAVFLSPGRIRTVSWPHAWVCILHRRQHVISLYL